MWSSHARIHDNIIIVVFLIVVRECAAFKEVFFCLNYENSKFHFERNLIFCFLVIIKMLKNSLIKQTENECECFLLMILLSYSHVFVCSTTRDNCGKDLDTCSGGLWYSISVHIARRCKFWGEYLPSLKYN